VNAQDFEACSIKVAQAAAQAMGKAHARHGEDMHVVVLVVMPSREGVSLGAHGFSATSEPGRTIPGLSTAVLNAAEAHLMSTAEIPVSDHG
jgi:hypothetical protein